MVDAGNVKKLLEIRDAMGRENREFIVSNIRILDDTALSELRPDGSFEVPPAS